MAPIAAHECPSARGDRDCVGELAFGFGSGLERVADSAQCRSVADIGRVRLVCFEACCEFVSLVEDLRDGAGHGYHLRYSAGRAWHGR